MSKPSYSNKSYRHLDAPEDFLQLEDHEEERRNILPPQAHASSAPSFVSSILSSSIPSRKLPSDVSFIPVGVNYSTSDAISFPQKSFSSDFQHDHDILELPKPVCSVIDIIDGGRKGYPVPNARSSRRHTLSSTTEIDSLATSNSQLSSQSILSASHSSFPYSSQSDVYNVGLTAPSPQRSSQLFGHSSDTKGIHLTGMPTDLTMWDAISRRPTSPILHNNPRRSISPPTFTAPQISSQPFSFSPIPALLPPFNASLLPLQPTSNFTTSSTTTLPVGIVPPSPPSAILKHSTSNNNNYNGITVDISTQGPAALSSIFSNLSSSNSSPSSSRCATPTNVSLGRSTSPTKTFMIPVCNVQPQPKVNVGNNKRSHNKSVSATMVPDIINIVTEEMVNEAIGSKAVSDHQSRGSSIENQSKYNQLLALLHDMEKDIRPSYACSKSSIERLKRGIVHGRVLIREAVAEIERSSQRSNSEERQMMKKYPKMD